MISHGMPYFSRIDRWRKGIKLNLGRDVPRLVRLFRYSLGLIKLSPSFFMVGN